MQVTRRQHRRNLRPQEEVWSNKKWIGSEPEQENFFRNGTRECTVQISKRYVNIFKDFRENTKNKTQKISVATLQNGETFWIQCDAKNTWGSWRKVVAPVEGWIDMEEAHANFDEEKESTKLEEARFTQFQAQFQKDADTELSALEDAIDRKSGRLELGVLPPKLAEKLADSKANFAGGRRVSRKPQPCRVTPRGSAIDRLNQKLKARQTKTNITEEYKSVSPDNRENDEEKVRQSHCHTQSFLQLVKDVKTASEKK